MGEWNYANSALDIPHDTGAYGTLVLPVLPTPVHQSTQPSVHALPLTIWHCRAHAVQITQLRRTRDWTSGTAGKTPGAGWRAGHSVGATLQGPPETGRRSSCRLITQVREGCSGRLRPVREDIELCWTIIILSIIEGIFRGLFWLSPCDYVNVKICKASWG